MTVAQLDGPFVVRDNTKLPKRLKNTGCVNTFYKVDWTETMHRKEIDMLLTLVI